MVLTNVIPRELTDSGAQPRDFEDSQSRIAFFSLDLPGCQCSENFFGKDVLLEFLAFDIKNVNAFSFGSEGDGCSFSCEERTNLKNDPKTPKISAAVAAGETCISVSPFLLLPANTFANMRRSFSPSGSLSNNPAVNSSKKFVSVI